jgi:hypothetical protein
LIECEQQGPYTEEQVKQSLAEGLIPNDLPAWHEELADWVKVENLISSLSEAPGPTLHSEKAPKAGLSESPAQAAVIPLVSLSKEQGRSSFSKYVRFGAAILAALVVVGLSMGIGMWLTRPSVTTPNRVWFQVYARATDSETEWYGFLRGDQGADKTDIIVDFGKDVNLAEDDRLEGVYIPTSETGRWNNTSYRIYKLQGDFKFLDPQSVPY